MTLVDSATNVLDRAGEVFTDPAAVDRLERARHRLDEPLRVAIAGKVKAGKSTLLNALVGEPLAPTDTGECTKIVTWYRRGLGYEVLLHPVDGSAAITARFRRDDGAIDVDLDGRTAEQVDRIEITWPTSGLETMTLIDTPGVDSLTEGVADRAYDFLDPDDAETPADAVLYLMKHIHSSDLRLLEAFHDDSVSSPNPINAVAVLSRADEIGAGRIDSMASAKQIADRYGRDPRLRRLAQLVVPVAGLLAETAATLTQEEFGWLKSLAAVPTKELQPVLLSADRFVEARPETPLTSVERGMILDRFGMFGLRLSLALLRRGVVETSVELSDELVRRSGLTDLRNVLATLFVDRADVLKARSALLVVERLCDEAPMVEGSMELAQEVERIMAGAHPFNELTTLAALRSGFVKGKPEVLGDLERVLGALGTAPRQRLGLQPDDPTEVREGALAQLGRWQRVAESPFSGHDLSTAARVAIRTLEELVATTDV